LSFFTELKRRNVFRVGAAYTVFAWLVIQVVATIFPAFGFSEAAIRIVTILFVIGAVPTLILAWAFEWTPEGLKQEKNVEAGYTPAPKASKTLDRAIMVTLAVALGYFAVDKFVIDPARDQSNIEAATQAARMESRALSDEDRSIAVLPFVNQEYFADGMTEELLNILAKVPTLKVTARTSSFFFKGKDLPFSEIARTLSVKHILEGSVRRSGSRVRITAQLIDAGTETHLWSETYDRELEDVFAIQDEVANVIASALVDSFQGQATPAVDRSKVFASYEAYRTGRLHWWRRTPADIQKALDLFTRAIEADPGFAPAYAAAAESWLLLLSYGGVHYLKGIDSAEPLIEKALSIDPDAAEAYAARGLSRLITGQHEAAEVALRKAIELDEDYIPARIWLSNLYGEAGRIPEQGMMLQEAIAMDPMNELLAINYAENLRIRGEYEQAALSIEGLLRLQTNSPPLLNAMSALAINSGDLVGAWRYANAAHALDPSAAVSITSLSLAWRGLGDFEQAERVLVQGIEQAPGNVDLKQSYIELLLLQGRADEAEDLIYRLFSRDVSALPGEIQRVFHLDLGILNAIRSDWPGARDHLELAIDPDESQLFDNDQVFTLTTVTLLHRGMGDPELAEERLSTAERVVGHARINGVDDGDIFYELGCLFTLRDQKERALQSLEQAYEKGWRKFWALQHDGRLDSLREEPGFIALKQRIDEDVKQARNAVNAIISET
jgi:TolB-like protein/tetratricopeptide (TPR) repeat protein